MHMQRGHSFQKGWFSASDLEHASCVRLGLVNSFNDLTRPGGRVREKFDDSLRDKLWLEFAKLASHFPEIAMVCWGDRKLFCEGFSGVREDFKLPKTGELTVDRHLLIRNMHGWCLGTS
eukprot:3431222-Alexandrium_andersonii.AAC.1